MNGSEEYSAIIFEYFLGMFNHKRGGFMLFRSVGSNLQINGVKSQKN
jgi:hypothetical protein